MRLQVTEFPHFNEDDDDDLGPPGRTSTMTLEEAVAYLDEFMDQETANPGGMVDTYEPHFRLYLWATDWETEEKETRLVVQFVPEDEADKETMVESLIAPLLGIRASHYHFKATEVHVIFTSPPFTFESGRPITFMIKLDGTALPSWTVLVEGVKAAEETFAVTRYFDYRRRGRWYAPDDPQFGPGLTDDPVVRQQLREKAIRVLIAACEAGIEQLAIT